MTPYEIAVEHLRKQFTVLQSFGIDADFRQFTEDGEETTLMGWFSPDKSQRTYIEAVQDDTEENGFFLHKMLIEKGNLVGQWIDGVSVLND